MTFVFALAAFFVLYTYALYPLGMAAWARCRPMPALPPLPHAQCPPVTVVVAVHNEAKQVLGKIQDLRAMDYPQSKLRILFVSDGSTDDTEALLRQQTGIEVLAYPNRQGKAHALNLAMPSVLTPVVLLCDVRQRVDPLALRLVMARLMQDGVGAVSGELVHRPTDGGSATHVGLYWRYEKWIRHAESTVASVPGATGAFYVIWRAGFEALPDDTLLDDFEIPMQCVRRGQRVLMEPRALVYDQLQADLSGERKRKMRTLSGNFQSFARHPWLFSPWHNPIWLQFMSHKVGRLLVPYALVLALLSSTLSHAPCLQLAAAAQWLFYAAAVGSRWLPAWRRPSWVNFASVFLELNWVAMLAGLQFFFTRLDTRWDKT